MFVQNNLLMIGGVDNVKSKSKLNNVAFNVINLR